MTSRDECSPPSTTEKLGHIFLGTGRRLREIVGLVPWNGKLIRGGKYALTHAERSYAYKMNSIFSVLADHLKTGTLELQDKKANWVTDDMPWDEWVKLFEDIGFSVHYTDLQKEQDFALNLMPVTIGEDGELVSGRPVPARELDPEEVADLAVLTGKAKNSADWLKEYKKALEEGKALADAALELERQTAEEEVQPPITLKPKTGSQKRKEKRVKYEEELGKMLIKAVELIPESSPESSSKHHKQPDYDSGYEAEPTVSESQ